MTLPKIPYITTIITVGKHNLMIRPMLSREEKILLYAKESKEAGEIFRAIRQVVNNCVMTDTFDVDSLAIFELQFVFLKLRSISISNQINISITEAEKEVYEFVVNLDDVQIKYPELSSNTALIAPDMWLNLKYPTAALYLNKDFLEASEENAIIELLIKTCIESVTTKNVTTPFEGTDEEKNTFIDDLPIKTREEILKYLNNLPSLYHKIEYETKMGEKKVIEMKTLNDFFTLA